MKAIFSLLAVVGLAAAQTVNVYSDKNCGKLVKTINCKDVYHKCTDLPTGIYSFEVTNSGGQECNAATSIYNTFVFYSTKDTKKCGEPTENGGGGPGACAPNGCEPVFNDQYSDPPVASLSVICMPNFNGQKLRRREKIRGKLIA